MGNQVIMWRYADQSACHSESLDFKEFGGGWVAYGEWDNIDYWF